MVAVCMCMSHRPARSCSAWPTDMPESRSFSHSVLTQSCHSPRPVQNGMPRRLCSRPALTQLSTPRLYRITVGETPDCSLCGERRGLDLGSPDGGRCPIAMPLNDPALVIAPPEGQQRQAELLDGGKVPQP